MRRKYARRKLFSRRRSNLRSKSSRKMAFAKGSIRGSRKSRQIFRMMNSMAEKKMVVYNASLGGETVGSAGWLNNGPTITQGVTKGTRTGNKIFVRYIIFKGLLNTNNTAVTEIRICGVWPKQNTNVALGDCPTNSIIQPWDLDKFTVLFDKIKSVGNPLNPTINAYQNNTGVPMTRSLLYKFKVFKSYNYDDNATVPNSTFPFLFMWANDGVLPSPIIYYNVTWTFTDV